MASEFGKIKTYEGWKAKLQELLRAGEQASNARDSEARLAVAERLNAFVFESFPNDARTLALDEIAGDAVDALTAAVISDEVEAIGARTAALRALAKRLEGVAAQTEKVAAALRLDKAHKAVDALTSAIRALDDLGTVLETGDDDALRKRLVKLGGTMLEMRGQLEKSA